MESFINCVYLKNCECFKLCIIACQDGRPVLLCYNNSGSLTCAVLHCTELHLHYTIHCTTAILYWLLYHFKNNKYRQGHMYIDKVTCISTRSHVI